MKRVLIVSYHFPPCGGGGVQRTAKFVKYLPEFGWEATVVCPDWNSDHSTNKDGEIAAETSFAELVYAGLPVTGERGFWGLLRHVPLAWRLAPALKANLRYPDAMGAWARDAIAAGSKRLCRGGCDILYSTSPPVTSHFVAMTLGRRFDLPWVADFRDPWTDNKLLYLGRTSVRKQIDVRLERSFYGQCTTVIANTEANRQTMIERHAVSPRKVVVIPNGFDEEDFSGGMRDASTDCFRVTYCGSAYAQYTPLAFVPVLKKFLSRRPNAKIRWTIAGSACEWIRDQQLDPSVQRTLELLNYVPHRQVPQLLTSSQCLLQVYPQGLSYSVPGKLFEYLRSGTPVLALGDRPSEVERILNKTDGGAVFTPDDIAGAASFLEKRYENWQRGRGDDLGAQRTQVSMYERRYLTEQFASVLDVASSSMSKNHTLALQDNHV